MQKKKKKMNRAEKKRDGEAKSVREAEVSISQITSQFLGEEEICEKGRSERCPPKGVGVDTILFICLVTIPPKKSSEKLSYHKQKPETVTLDVLFSGLFCK